MTTEANPNGAQAAPNAPVQSANAAPAIPAPSADDPNKEPSELPPWVLKRIDQAKRSGAKEADASARKAVLAELGIDDVGTIKKLAEDEKKRQEAQKSLETKLAERELALSNKDARLKELEEAVKLDAAEQLAALTEEQRKAVVELAGEDPAKQRKAIATLRPTWAKPAATAQQSQETQTNGSGSQGSSVPQTQTQPQAAPAVPAKPAAATAPGATAPPPAGTVVVTNHLETYNAMNDPKSPNYAPHYAAAYYARYQDEIVAAQKSRNAN